MKDFEEKFPCCKKCNKELYDDALHHYMVMKCVADRLNIPLEELINFFTTGEQKMRVITEQEEVLQEYERGD